MRLKNKYVFGCLVQFYEINMLSEYVESCVQMIKGVENPENVNFHFCFSFQENLEKIDVNLFREKYPINPEILEYADNDIKIEDEFFLEMVSIINSKLVYTDNLNIVFSTKDNKHDFYNIAAYRRELNDTWCDKVDYVCWGESDSLWPKQTLLLIESLHEMVAEDKPKFIASFAGRKNWDSSWETVTHPLFRKVQYIDSDEWILENEASEKAYMTIDRMNEINDIPLDQVDILEMTEPKADGSCLIISSELIRSGVNIPRSLIHCGEDESFLQMAKIVMGKEFIQYNFNNILRVHNRRHPHKRTFVLNEDNARGFCDDRKGKWWKILEDSSKYNLATLRQQKKSIPVQEVLDKIKDLI